MISFVTLWELRGQQSGNESDFSPNSSVFPGNKPSTIPQQSSIKERSP